MVKIDFESNTKYGVYRDAIYLPDDHSFTEAEIEAMKQERVANWLQVVDSPPEE
jgi:hypothetical protein